MEKTLYIKILESLAVYGVGFELDISHSFDGVVKDVLWKTKEEAIIDFLKEMETNKHIKFRNEAKLVNNNGNYEDPKYVTIIASITFIGFDYYNEYLVKTETMKSFIDTKTIQTNQIWIATATVVVLIISIIVSTWLTLSDRPNEKQMQVLQLNLSQQEKATQQLKDSIAKEIDSVLKKKNKER